MPVDPDALTLSPLFSDLSAADLQVLAGWLDEQQVGPGQRLTHQASAGYAFYVLVTASARVLIDGEEIRTLGPGDHIGEISMLEDGRQTATVEITTPGMIWSMFGTRFRELQSAYPDVAASIERTARQRQSPADGA